MERIVEGGSIELRTVYSLEGVPTDTDQIRLTVMDPDGGERDQTGAIVHDDTGSYHAVIVGSAPGVWRFRWTVGTVTADEGEFEVESIYVSRVAGPTDVRVLVPRVQRAVEGVVRAQWKLTPDEVKDLVADAMADVVLYTGSIFGSQLIVTHVDPVTQAPDEYATSVPIVPEQGSVIAAQAALNYFFYRFSGAKMSERISDEASTWEYSLSPNLLAAQLKLLKDERDLALQSIAPPLIGMDSYVSFLAQRDNVTARLVEPWVYGHPEGYGIGAGGLEGDFRFDQLPSGGGDYSGLS